MVIQVRNFACAVWSDITEFETNAPSVQVDSTLRQDISAAGEHLAGVEEKVMHIFTFYKYTCYNNTAPANLLIYLSSLWK